MRKIVLLTAIITVILPLFAMDYHLMRDDSTGTYWYWYEKNNLTFRYWAVHYYTSDTCTLRTVDWGRWTKAGKLYDDSIIVCFDNGGYPDIDSTIYKAVQPTGTNGVDSIVRHTVTGNPLAWGHFWVVVYAETQNSNAYFLSDTIGSGFSYVSGDGITWNELYDGIDNADAIIRAWVSGPEGMVTMKQEYSNKPDEEYKEEISFPGIAVANNSSFYFSINEKSYINAYLTDKTGRIIEQYCSGYMDPGEYNYSIQSDLGTGVYFIVINHNGRTISRKLLYF